MFVPFWRKLSVVTAIFQHCGSRSSSLVQMHLLLLAVHSVGLHSEDRSLRYLLQGVGELLPNVFYQYLSASYCVPLYANTVCTLICPHLCLVQVYGGGIWAAQPNKKVEAP